MALRIDLGQYVPASSPVHRLDARVKLCCAVAVALALFSASGPASLLVGAAAVLACVRLARVPVARALSSLLPLAPFLVLVCAFNLLFVRGGAVLLAVGPVCVTAGGARAAALYAGRFAVALVAGALVLMTTTPTQLADALDRLLSPLGRLGLPAHQLAMVLALMLRFVPTIADEARDVMDAQSMRGGGLDEGGPVRRLRALGSVVSALLAGCLRHAEGLSRALDARCYQGEAARTHLHDPRLRRSDAVAVALSAATVAAIVAL